MKVSFSDYPMKWLKRTTEAPDDLKILGDALAASWEKRNKPIGDALDCQWNSLCLDAVFALRNDNITISYGVDPEDEMQLGYFEITLDAYWLTKFGS